MTTSSRYFDLPSNILSWPVTPGVVGAGHWHQLPVSALTDRDGVRYSNSVWKAVVTNIVLAHNKKFRNVVPAKIFAGWLLRCSRNAGGRYYVAKQLKQLSFEYRQWSVTGRRPTPKSDVPRTFQKWLAGHVCHAEARAQIARIGRCLPEGDTLVQSKAIKAHRSIVTRPPCDVNMELADDIYYWARKFSTDNAHLFKEEVSWAPNENSASQGATILEGGRMEELIRDAKAESDFESVKSLAEGDFDPWVSKALDDAVYMTACTVPPKKEWIPDVMAIAEKGYKARVLTKFPAAALVVGDVIRRQMWAMVSDKPWADMDRQPDDVKFLSTIRSALDRHGICVSSDLSNATDYIPHIYAQALWAGLLEPHHVMPYINSYCAIMFSSMKLRYPDGTVVTSARGIHMGTPLSFLTLTLLHRFCVEKAGYGSYPHIIRGDDLLGIFPRPEVYFNVMQQVGFSINRAKTIISRTGGTFAERTVRFSHSLATQELSNPLKRTLGQFIPVNIISSVKVLQDLPVGGVVRATPGKGSLVKALGRWFSQTSNIVPRQRRKAYRAIGLNHGDLVIRLSTTVPPHLPLDLGGAGLPDRKGRVGLNGVPFAIRAAIGHAASHHETAVKLTGLIARTDGVSRGFVDVFSKKDFREQWSKSIWTTEPQETEFYQRTRRYWRYFGHRDRPSRPISFRQWRSGLMTLPRVKARWVPRSNSDPSRLANRIRSMTGTYIPYTQPTTGSTYQWAAKCG
ncbi:RNA-dependent RNA polymerase [Hubei narna-like virus 19]|uniref:RNA-dependent RNA polymerase n=1 Tax=Hubei narna-like virus 19 TaxID=1922949 RepID=UPI00090AB6C1|nr:RNA-dependent RNA polymerase [Hubei narna-like virus 19]APG77152.1 RNA-dependent RNA polymerase [Hubei narna-like virus 19]